MSRPCDYCTAPIDPARLARSRRVRFCSRRCGEADAWGAHADRQRAGIAASGTTDLIDLTGRTFGSLVVLRRSERRGPGHTYWDVRCRKCDRVRAVTSGLLRRGDATQCADCRLASALGAAARAPGAERGRCSWCRRPAKGRKPFECQACDRQASRRGRDATGRPRVAPGHVRVVDQSALAVVANK